METIFYKEFWDETPVVSPKMCDSKGCEKEGVHRAPISRVQLNQYYWFCLDHVRSYNAQWNYYQGLEEDQIEEYRRFEETWERPTWPFGRGRRLIFRDPFDFWRGSSWEKEPSTRPFFPPQSDEAKALDVLKVQWPMPLDALKKHYRSLVKRYHPDLNQGCPRAQETLKAINQAYTVLKKQATF